MLVANSYVCRSYSGKTGRECLFGPQHPEKGYKSALQFLFWQFDRSKKLETKNILIDDENYKDLVIYFTRYVYSKSIKLLSLHCHELIGKVEGHEGKKTSDIWWLHAK